MDHAEQLNNLIDIVSNSVEKIGYNGYENQSALDKLRDANVFFTTSVLGMQAISHVIEDQAMTLGGSFRFYTAFQKYSRAKNQQVRYRKLLEVKNPVYLFGIPDVSLWKDPNLIEVSLDTTIIPGQPHLSRNWFVILYNPQLVSMALVSREVPSKPRPAGAPDKLVYRNFEGFWTYDMNVISEVVTILDGYIEQRLGARA